MASSQRPTLREVARLAGLSVTQTSRALNGHSDVSVASRQKAEDAARRLGYVPNLEARRLKMPGTRSLSLGLVLVSSQRFSDPFLGNLLATTVDEAAANGYELQLSSPLADEDPILSYERAILSKRVDGFIVLRTTLQDPRVEYLARYPFPFVAFDRGVNRGEDAPTFPVVAETADCLQPAVDHLVELGHTRISCLIEPAEYRVGAGRHRSFLAAMAARGLTADDRLVVPSGFRDDTAYVSAGQLLDGANRPTALVASNDLLALGAMRAAQDRGLDVPRDLSIVGFDNITAAQLSRPGLTTLAHTEGTIGRHLVAQLLRAIDEPGPVKPVNLKPHLIVRESTAPAAD